jgi:hypothetical protein
MIVRIVPVLVIVLGLVPGLFVGPETRLAWPGPALHAQAANNSTDQLDREFYNEYLDSLPDTWAPNPEILQSNLFATLRRILPREDPFEGPEYLRSLTPDGFEYKRVTLDSPFVRGLFKEAPYLQKTAYMWIVKSGPYLIFVSYRADPERYTLSEHQNLVIKKRPPDKSDDRHKADDS